MSRVLLAAVALVAVVGCDALVGGECADGFAPVDGRCAPLTGELVTADDLDGEGGNGEGGIGGSPGDTGGIDVPIADPCQGGEVLCAAGCFNLQTSPTSCGACGNVCSSGICVDGSCVGDVTGHVVALGMSYEASTAASRLLLGNAAFMSLGDPVRILDHRRYADDASAEAVEDILHEQAAIRSRAASIAIAHGDDHVASVEPGEHDVIIIHDQPHAPPGWGAGFAALAGEPIRDFVASGGTLIVLATENSDEMTAVLNGVAELGVDDVVPLLGTRLVKTDTTDVLSVGVPTPLAARTTTSAFETSLMPGSGLSFVFADELDPTRPVAIHKGIDAS